MRRLGNRMPCFERDGAEVGIAWGPNSINIGTPFAARQRLRSPPNRKYVASQSFHTDPRPARGNDAETAQRHADSAPSVLATNRSIRGLAVLGAGASGQSDQRLMNCIVGPVTNYPRLRELANPSVPTNLSQLAPRGYSHLRLRFQRPTTTASLSFEIEVPAVFLACRRCRAATSSSTAWRPFAA